MEERESFISRGQRHIQINEKGEEQAEVGGLIATW